MRGARQPHEALLQSHCAEELRSRGRVRLDQSAAVKESSRAGQSLIHPPFDRDCAAWPSLAKRAAGSYTPYDGLWSVSLSLDQGSCDTREIDVFIRNGEISHAGDSGFFTADGRVDERGRLEVSIGGFRYDGECR